MSLLCFLAFIFLPVVKCFTEVQMALMVPNDTHRLFSVDIVLPAVNIGILRARSFLPSDVNFTVHYADSKCHIGVGINEAIKLWYAGKVHVFFGPVCDYAVAPVARQVGQRLTLIKGQVTGSLQCSISNVAIIFEAPPPLFPCLTLTLYSKFLFWKDIPGILPYKENLNKIAMKKACRKKKPHFTFIVQNLDLFAIEIL